MINVVLVTIKTLPSDWIVPEKRHIQNIKGD
jgi:hypothetical protein